MVTVRGRKKSLAPQMRPPVSRPRIGRSPSASEEDELLEDDSNSSREESEVTFVQPPAQEASDVETDNSYMEGDSTTTVNQTMIHAEAAPIAPKVAAVKVATETVAVANAKAHVPCEGDAGVVAPSVNVGDKLNNSSTSNRSTESNDSGNSEPMETEVKFADDGMVGLFGAVSMIEEQVRVQYPITARPPCTVDCSVVSIYNLGAFYLNLKYYYLF